MVKRTTVATIGFMWLLLLLVFSSSQSIGIKTAEADGKARVTWRSTYLMDWFEQYWPGEASESLAVCNYINYIFWVLRSGYAYQLYSPDTATTKDNILYRVQDFNDNYDYATVFHYGHGSTWAVYGLYWVPPWYRYYIPVQHYQYWDSPGNNVFDYEIYPLTGSGTHQFVFFWTCGTGQEIGYYDESWTDGYVYYFGTGAVGMPFAWTHTTNLSEDGYASPDSGPNCFIGFYNAAKPLSEIAADGKTYGYFVRRFYYHALQYNEPIIDALDYAAEVIWGVPFGNSILYNGWWAEIPGHGWYWCQMRVYGNGGNIIPT